MNRPDPPPAGERDLAKRLRATSLFAALDDDLLARFAEGTNARARWHSCTVRVTAECTR